MAGKRTAKNIYQLNDIISFDMKLAMAGIKDEVLEEAKKILEKVVYGYNAQWYTRTDDLRDSLVIKMKYSKKNGPSFEVTHDYRSIHSNPSRFEHGSKWSDPNNASSFIPQFINEGVENGMFGNGAFSRPRPYIAEIEKQLIYSGWLERKLLQEMGLLG